MKDITQSIIKAIGINMAWSINEFYSFIEDVQTLGIKTSYWEGEENWATIVIDDITIGYIWKLYPFIFLLIEKANLFQELLKEYNYIVVIYVSELSSNELLIKPEAEILNRMGNLNYDEPTSAEDIWFNSVT